jgi:hypothetical protein
VFQLHYAIPLFLLGFLTGAILHRSLVLKCAVAILSFTSVFGIGWGAITVIEIALGFVLGNSVFGRRRPTTTYPIQLSGTGRDIAQPQQPPRIAPKRVIPKLGKTIVCDSCGHRRTIDQEMMTSFLVKNPIRSSTPYDPSIETAKLRFTACASLGASIV